MSFLINYINRLFFSNYYMDDSENNEDRKTKKIMRAISPIKYVLFDLDGTLLNNRRQCYESVCEVLKHYGAAEGFTEDKYRDIWGGNINDFWRRAGIPAEVPFNEIDDRFWEVYPKTLPHECFEGTEEALLNVAGDCNGIALVTASRRATLDHFLEMPAPEGSQMRDLFLCVAPKCNSGRGKTIESVANMLGTPLRSIAYVDDCPYGLRDAKELGTLTVGMLEGHASEERIRAAKPDYEIHSPTELVGIVRRHTY
jgi:beta-phosphoglucomutase-like phosphatase (HAD superfamily)